MSCLSYRTERKVSLTELKNTVHLQSALIEVWAQAFHSSLLLFSYVGKDIRILISADKHALKLIGALGPPSAARAARAARFLLLSFHEVMFGRRINMSWSSAMKKKLRRIVLGFFLVRTPLSFGSGCQRVLKAPCRRLELFLQFCDVPGCKWTMCSH